MDATASTPETNIVPMRQLRRLTSASVQSPLETYLSEINQTTLLSAEEEKLLAVRIEEGDIEARDRMVRANLRLVVNIARSYTGKGLGLEDLIAEGNLGLMRAVEGFDPSMNTRFSAYASYWIEQSIKRALINTGKSVQPLPPVPSSPTHVKRKGRLFQRLFGVNPNESQPPAPPPPGVDLTAYRQRAQELLKLLLKQVGKGAPTQFGELGSLAVKLEALIEDLKSVGAGKAEIGQLEGLLRDLKALLSRPRPKDKAIAAAWSQAEAVLRAFGGSPAGRRESFWK